MARDSRTKRPTGNPEPLRNDIDHGRTGDKVDYPDPATAPLGTDAEASGVSASQGAIQAERDRLKKLGDSESSFQQPTEQIRDDPMRDGHVWSGEGEAAPSRGPAPALKIIVLAAIFIFAVLVLLWLTGAA